MLYETLLILGGSIGNALDLLEFPIPIGSIPGSRPCSGAYPSWTCRAELRRFHRLPGHVPGGNGEGGSRSDRRLRLSVGIQYMTLSIALGKMTGSLLYFYKGFGGGGS